MTILKNLAIQKDKLLAAQEECLAQIGASDTMLDWDSVIVHMEVLTRINNDLNVIVKQISQMIGATV